MHEKPHGFVSICVHKISLALRRWLRCVARRDQLLAGNSTGENVKVVC